MLRLSHHESYWLFFIFFLSFLLPQKLLQNSANFFYLIIFIAIILNDRIYFSHEILLHGSFSFPFEVKKQGGREVENNSKPIIGPRVCSYHNRSILKITKTKNEKKIPSAFVSWCAVSLPIIALFGSFVFRLQRQARKFF